ncbi:MAG: oligoribonuclease [Proteobacteria bacterium]|nr:oligoribonuclease [Pseudomonadota bacterium]
MAQDQNNLIWLDMEMTGLDPDRDRIIEIAVVITDAKLDTVAESPVLVVHQPDAVLQAMDQWNKDTHGRSGLIEKVKASQLSEAAAAAQMLEFVKQYVPARTSPMCGNSICQDRRFMARHMPHVEGAGAALEAGSGQGRGQERQARSACRHLRVDHGDEVLPRQLPAPVGGGSTAAHFVGRAVPAEAWTGARGAPYRVARRPHHS